MKLISIGSDHNADGDNVNAYIIETMGMAFLRRLRETFGGLDLHVPREVSTLHEEHTLVIGLGLEAASELVRLFSGERIYIRHPPRDTSKPYLDLMKEGLSNGQIAQRLGVSVRGVRLALARVGVKNPNVAPYPRRTRSGQRLSEEEFQRRAQVYLRYRRGEFENQAAAAIRLGLKRHTFEDFIKAYRSRLDEYVAAHSNASPAISNAALTRLASISAPFTRPASETRVSGP